MNHLRTTVAAAITCLCLSFAACEQKDLGVEFNKVTNGMTLSQVENLLGSGTDDTSSAGYGVSTGGVLDSKAAAEKTYIWKESTITYQVVFKDGKVVQKSKAGQ